jgi:hypothetical protein
MHTPLLKMDCVSKDLEEVLFKKGLTYVDTIRGFNAFLLPYIAFSPIKGFQIGRCTQVPGGVLFVNETTASGLDQGVRFFEYLQPACGAGLRIMVNKQSRTNILIDLTIGDKSTGIYFSAQEAF